MKEILITGINSYIGNQFEDWVISKNIDYQIKKISVRNDEWKEMDWSKFDIILHVAGIAHNSRNKNLQELYYAVNRDLTGEIAKKAKKDGVRHFINMSSIIIFGSSKSKIDDKTLPKPDNFYGDSKLQGEMKLNELTDNSFKVSHIRPPMVYGSNSKGNFPLLVKLAGITPAFPNYENKRSMIYIKNLCNFIVEVIENEIDGELHPQNSKYVKTSDLVQAIGNYNQNTIVLVNGLNSIIKSLSNLNVIQKMFGDLYYSEEMYDGDVLYACYNLEESIADIFE